MDCTFVQFVSITKEEYRSNTHKKKIVMGVTGEGTVLRLMAQSFVLVVLLGIRGTCIRARNNISSDDDGSDTSSSSISEANSRHFSKSSRYKSHPESINRGTVNAVYSLFDRTLQDHPKAKDSIRLHIVDDDNDHYEESFLQHRQRREPNNSRRQWFRLEQKNMFNRSNSTDTVIVITATSASELSAGLGYYFKEYCNFTIEWSTGGRAGGSHIVFPHVWPVPLGNDKKSVVRHRTTKWSYLMNVCTHSYSLVWYDWSAWQKLIDNLALRGINMILALTGQEEIQYRVFSELGLNDRDIRSWFNGPAFLTWSRGQNEYGSDIAGPLPRSFMKSQWSLQREHILPRLRSLGMIGVLPAFQGNVPIQLKSLYNDSNITQQGDTGWLDSLDPLFLRIANLWMSQLIKDFGTDHYYQLDGWFNGGVPPWRNHNQYGRENFTATRRWPSSSESKTYSSTSKKTLSTIPHDQTWYRRGQAAYAGLNSTDPNAHWMYQGFAFVGWDTNEQASYVKGFVDSAPLGKFIVVDMGYSPEGEWQKWNSSFFGAPFIWSKLHNFGNTNGMRGDLNHLNSVFPYQALEAQSSIIGIGATPEGIDQNPIYYEFLYEQNFRPAPVKNLKAYLISTNHKRYGLKEHNKYVHQAWELLLNSSYAQDFSVQDLTAVAHLNPRPSSSLFESDRIAPKPVMCDIFNAWTNLIQAADHMKIWTQPFLYDLVNVGREVLAHLTTPMALNFSDARSMESMDHEELTRTGGLYVDLLLDLDRLLGTNTAFLLGSWLESARRLAQKDVSGGIPRDCFSSILSNRSQHHDDDGCCRHFYEWNAKVQITTWNPTTYDANQVPDGPVDYAAKHWNGLVQGYYAKRAKILLRQALRDQQNSQPLNSTMVQRIFAAHAYEWTTSVSNEMVHQVPPFHLLPDQRSVLIKTLTTSKEMLSKYSHWFEPCGLADHQ